jgi:serine protease Do
MRSSLPLPTKYTATALGAALMFTGVMMANPAQVHAASTGGYADLVEEVSPAVVFIEVTGSRPAAGDRLPPNMPEQFRRYFEDREQRPGHAGLGSGFIIRSDGQIVTNHHVVSGADAITVTLADGQRFEAEIVGSDPLTDIALLRVEADDPLPIVDFGASKDLRVGDEVIAVGNPFGLGGTVTSGIVSALSRNINAGPFDDFIQTDAAINRGNSGGPLFDSEGDVIGVNTAIISPRGGSVGIGFAVPSDLVQTVIDDLADDGKLTRGWLGVSIRPMTDEVAEVLGYEMPKGAVIETVSQDSPAEKAGLKKGDIILSYAGAEITDLRDLTRAVATTKPKARVSLTVLRKGAERKITAMIGRLRTDTA